MNFQNKLAASAFNFVDPLWSLEKSLKTTDIECLNHNCKLPLKETGESHQSHNKNS